MLKLIAIVGTNSKRSTNRQLLQYMQKHFADKAEIELVEIKAIPVFNKPADKQVPAEILEIAAKIEEADGVIIGTPEYDHSIPAVLMSALAWLSYGIYPLLNKPIMITGASYGTLGSSRAQLQLRQILMLLKSRQMFFQMNSCSHTLFKHLTQVATWLTLMLSRNWMPSLMTSVSL